MVIGSCWVLGLLLVLMSAGHATQPLPGATAQPGLARFLDPHGSLQLPAGFAGHLDPSGFHLSTEKRSGLRFTRGGAKLFGVPGGCNGHIFAIEVAPSGLIYLGGEFSICEEVPASLIVAYDPSTRRFSALGSGAGNGLGGDIYASVYALSLSGNDLYVGGDFISAGGQPARNVARWNGQSWSALGSDETNGVTGVVFDLLARGSEVYVGGSFDRAGGQSANLVARWNGSSWSALGSGLGGQVDPYVAALALSGTDLYAGGAFTTAGGATANRIARWNGSSWSALGSNGTNGPVNALAFSGSDLYVGGDFSAAGGLPANNLARWNGGVWSVLGDAAQNGVDGAVFALRVVGSDLYVGGVYRGIGTLVANFIARWNGSSWSALGADEANGVSSTVFAIGASGSQLYLGGYFDQAGGLPANFAAHWNGRVWSALGSGVGNGVNNVISALAILGDDLYAGGRFSQAGGQIANFIARWNGSTWSPLLGGGNGVNSDVLALGVLGNQVYVGGYFSQAGGAPAALIASWNGSVWSTLGAGLGGGDYPSVQSIAAIGSDLYVGGEFIEAGGQPAFKIARWNGTSWSALGSGNANGVSRGDFIGVQAITAFGSDVIVGGNFAEAGGAPAFGVARWNGSSWSSLGSGAQNGVNNGVLALAVQNGSLYVGGGFSQAGGQSAENIARWDGNTWSALGAGVNGTVHSLTVKDGELFVGGTFTLAGDQAANGLARWNGSTWRGLSVDAPPQSVRALAADARSLYAGGAGLAQTPLPDLQSRSLAGSVANGASKRVVVSRDGGKISFASDASNLVSNDVNGRTDVFVRDPVTGITTRSSAAAEVLSGGTDSFSDPALSADGSRVAYAGSSGQLYATIGGLGRLLSQSPTGAAGNGASGKVRLPGAGNLAFFESQASNLLTAADGNGVSDIFVRDLGTGSNILISRAPDGSAANGPSFGPWASDDGQTIVYSSLATNIVAGTNLQSAGTKAGTILQAMLMRGGNFGQSRFYLSRNLGNGELGNGDSLNVRVTPDGRYGVFESLASNLGADDNNQTRDIFRFEVSSNTVVKLERISTSRYGFQGNGPSKNASISDDGQFITFETDASNLVELDRNNSADVLVKWMVTGEVLRLSRTADGQQPNGASIEPAISGDASTIVFASAASNLAPNDANNAADVYSVRVVERQPVISAEPLAVVNLSTTSGVACAAFYSVKTFGNPGIVPGVTATEITLQGNDRRLVGGLIMKGNVLRSGAFAGVTVPATPGRAVQLAPVAFWLPPDLGAATLEVVTGNTTLSSVRLPARSGAQVIPPILLGDRGGYFSVRLTPDTQAQFGNRPFAIELGVKFLDNTSAFFDSGTVVGGVIDGNNPTEVSFCMAQGQNVQIRTLGFPTYGDGVTGQYFTIRNPQDVVVFDSRSP